MVKLKRRPRPRPDVLAARLVESRRKALRERESGRLARADERQLGRAKQPPLIGYRCPVCGRVRKNQEVCSCHNWEEWSCLLFDEKSRRAMTVVVSTRSTNRPPT